MNSVEVYYNISSSQLSIARHYGGLKVNGVEYRYVAENDSLVREDIWQKDKKMQDAEKRKWIQQYKEQQRFGKELERAKQEFMF